MTPTAKTVLYVRVSTAEQTSAHQLEQARGAGYQIADDNVITDHGVSGVTTRLQDRDQGKRLYDLLQAGDTLLVRWVDRLGRNYDDVKDAIETFNKKGVTVRTIINNMTFQSDYDLAGDDTGKAVRNALLGFMAAMASADTKAKTEARQAGIKHAKEGLDADRKYRGKKPSYTRQTFDLIQDMLGQTRTVTAIAKECGVSRQTVIRIRTDPSAASAALDKWGMDKKAIESA
jgi:DNA invertase Pin-like site-specific DNA recombinase